MASCHRFLVTTIVFIFGRLCLSNEIVNKPLSENLVEFDGKLGLRPIHLPRTANAEVVAEVVHQTLHPDEPPGKLRVEADDKDLNLHNWILPCGLLVDKERHFGRSIQSSNSTFSLSRIANIIRAASFLKCVALSETLHLPVDILIDYYKAAVELRNSKSLKIIIPKLMLLPFTFLISLRDLITKLLAYIVTSMLPLFW